MHICMYIYIYIERERDVCCIYIYIHTYIHTHIYLYFPPRVAHPPPPKEDAPNCSTAARRVCISDAPMT